MAFCWERAVLLAFRLWCFILCCLNCLCSFPVWCLEPDVEYDCIGSWLLSFHLLQKSMYALHPCPLSGLLYLGSCLDSWSLDVFLDSLRGSGLLAWRWYTVQLSHTYEELTVPQFCRVSLHFDPKLFHDVCTLVLAVMAFTSSSMCADLEKVLPR